MASAGAGRGSSGDNRRPMNALFEDGGKFHAGRVMSETDASLQIELASGKRSKVKAANVLLRFAAPEPEALLAAAEPIAREIDLDLAWEFAPEGEFAFAELARDYFGAERRRDAGGGRAARPVRRAALLSPPRQGALSQGAGRDRQGGPARHRAQAPGRGAGRRVGGRARRRHLPGADPRADLPHPLQARQERARIQGRRRGVAALRPGAARPAEGRRRDRLAVRVPLAPLPVRGVPEGRRLRRRRRCRASARSCALSPAAGVLDRRLVDDRDRRRALGAGPRHGPGHRRHPHRRAGARRRARLGGGADRARPPLDRLHPRPQADDAARCRGRRVHARRRPRRRGRLALRDDRRGDAGDARQRDARSSACASPPTCATTSSRTRSTRRRSPPACRHRCRSPPS